MIGRKIAFGKVIAAALFWLALAVGTAARADRTVLAPTGETLSPDSYRTEFALNPVGRFQNFIWIQYSTPQSIELETERTDIAGEHKKGYALNVQYPLTVSLSRSIPTISVGVRDVTGTGDEHGAFYIVTTKSFSLSDWQYRYIHDFKIDAGVGTGRIGGLFLGVQTQLKTGLRFRAELYRRQANLTVALPIGRNLEARAYSLDSHIFYGLSFSMQH